MNNSLLTPTFLLTTTALALSAVASHVAAQNTDSSAYLKDTRGGIVKNPFALCWRTGYWSPAMAICECDPDIAQACTPPAPKAVRREAQAAKGALRGP